VCVESTVEDRTVMRDQKVWSVKECAAVLHQSINELKQQLHKTTTDNDLPPMLVWDKVLIAHWPIPLAH